VACGLLRVSALRVALVARSSQPEKRLDDTLTSTAYVTAAAPTWMGSDAAAHVINDTEADNVAIAPGPTPCPDWPGWCDYRYKVFQTVVPLRNITNQSAVTGC
jgi:type IV pilus assembly protein PilW